MRKITVKAASRTYDVIIDKGLLSKAGKLASEVISPCTAAIVIDDNVDRLYSETLRQSLEDAGFRTVKYVFPNGEASKNPENLVQLVNFLAENQLTRSDAVFALGGGVTGDLAGFAASVFLRGIHFVQVPTTLLSAVDSSVGGKTAVDLPSGKNLMGSFYQPDMVICDYSTLSTLTDDVFSDGCAEVIKYGMLTDPEIFDLVKKAFAEESRETDNIEEILYRCISIKRDIVERDELDKGDRQLLNLGHTFGHSIEKASGYGISHGKAVAMGMVIITKAGIKKGFCPADCLDELVSAIESANLPVKTQYTAEELADTVLSDKKRKGNTITFVIPEKSGKCILQKFPIEEIPELLTSGLA